MPHHSSNVKMVKIGCSTRRSTVTTDCKHHLNATKYFTELLQDINTVVSYQNESFSSK